MLSNDKDWKLLEWITINDITLLCYYNGDLKQSGLIIFNLESQPNELSRRSPLSTWGYCTHAVFNMHTLKEAAEIYGLYLKDIESDNVWWENE